MSADNVLKANLEEAAGVLRERLGDRKPAVGKPERIRILARERNGVRRDIGSNDARVGTLVGDRARDATAPRAQISHE